MYLYFIYAITESFSSCKEKTVCSLGESKNCTILMGFYIEEGINPKDAAFARYEG